MKFLPHHFVKPALRLFIPAVFLFSITACGGVDVPNRDVPNRQQLIGSQSDSWSKVPALRRIPVSADLFLSRSMRPPIPTRLSERQIDLKFPSGAATLDDFTGIMELQNIPVVLRPSSSQSDNAAAGGQGTQATIATLGSQRLPFRSFNGSLDQLVEKINRSMDVVAWWESGSLFISDRDRYVVSLPQHKAVIDAVSAELKSFGADNITTSVYGGRIVYTARPQLNEDVIEPYFKSLAGNLSEITMQVAVVALTLNDAAERGFDWSSFQFQLGDPTRAGTTDLINSAQGNITGTTPLGGSLGTSTRTGGKLSASIVEPFFGSDNTVYGISAAILYLNQFGTTKTKQMVELRTLAGMPVQLRSGQEIPYIKGVSATTTPGGTTAGNVSNSIQTETVSTGLTLKLTPFFDSLMQLVVIDVGIEVASVPEFRVLSSGNVLNAGSSDVDQISQPVKEERTLNDIVRIRAGETVILGGIREERQTDNRTAPFNFFETLGSKATTEQTTLNFFIMRPVVTIYEPVSSKENARVDEVISQGENTLPPSTMPVAPATTMNTLRPVAAAGKTSTQTAPLPMQKAPAPTPVILPPLAQQAQPETDQDVQPGEPHEDDLGDAFGGGSNMFGRDPTESIAPTDLSGNTQ